MQNTITYKGQKYKVTWKRTNSADDYSPITQVYGVCFSKEGKVLVARSSKKSQWLIPGGHPERNESIEETLQREVLEEVDVKIKNMQVVGVQKVEVVGKPKATHYQVRCVCLIEELLPQTPDPANGKTWERRLIPVDRVTEYVKWGEVGKDLFEAATIKFNQIAKNN